MASAANGGYEALCGYATTSGAPIKSEIYRPIDNFKSVCEPLAPRPHTIIFTFNIQIFTFNSIEFPTE